MRQPARALRCFAAIATMACGLALAGAAQAQLSSTGGPIAASADSAYVVEAERVQVWTGRAEAIQGTTRVRADEIRISHSATSGGGIGDIERFVAMGNVFFVTPTQVIRGDEAVYTPGDDVIVVTGGVILRQGMDVLSGSRLTINVRQRRAVLEGQQTSEGRRVRGVFYPAE